MKTTTTYKSNAFKSVHASASVMLKVGAINKASMREFDAMCLAIVPTFGAPRIKRPPR